MIAVLEQLVLQRGFEVAKAGIRETAGLMDACDQPSPIEIPRSSVMRFENSADTSHSVAGGVSAVFDHWMVGSDSSSATQGSSMASVAGRKRAPTKQWANASE